MIESTRPAPRRRSAASAVGAFVLAIILAACSGAGGPSPDPTEVVLPQPVCGGLKIAIAGALPCERLVRIAIDVLAADAPAQLARGVTAIEVTLATCPAGEVPPQIDCTGTQFAQLVTVSFGPAPAGGPIEPSLTVALEPVSGRLLGIANPLVR